MSVSEGNHNGSGNRNKLNSNEQCECICWHNSDTVPENQIGPIIEYLLKVMAVADQDSWRSRPLKNN